MGAPFIDNHVVYKTFGAYLSFLPYEIWLLLSFETVLRCIHDHWDRLWPAEHQKNISEIPSAKLLRHMLTSYILAPLRLRVLMLHSSMAMHQICLFEMGA